MSDSVLRDVIDRQMERLRECNQERVMVDGLHDGSVPRAPPGGHVCEQT